MDRDSGQETPQRVSVLSELRRRRVFRVAASYAVIGWLVIQVGETVLEPLGFPDWVLPLLIWVVALGFPVALMLSWAYQMTSSGVVYDHGWMAAHPSRRTTGFLVFVAGVLVSIAALVYFIKPIERLTRIDSIAVLPFENLGGDPAGAVFAEGLAEQLLSRLQRVEGLKVPGRRTTELLVDREPSISSLGKALNVDAILEGGLRWAYGDDNGATVRIDLRLLQASDGFMVWSGEYTRQLDDVFALQEEVATAVIEAIEVDVLKASSARDQPTESIEAYELYLRARNAWYRREFASMMQSIEFYDQAILFDPGYADAWSGLAEAWVLAAIWGYIDAREPMERAMAAAQRALALDDSLPGTYVALGAIAHWYEWNDEEAERFFLKALEVDADYPTARNWYSIFLANTGRYQESLEQLSLALAVDPRNVIIKSQVAYTHLHAGEFELAAISASEALNIDARYIPARYYLGWAMQMNGQHTSAIRQTLRVAQPIPLFRQVLAQSYAASGRDEEVHEIIAELMETRERGEFYVSAFFMAVIYTQLGDIDEAFRWLDESIRERSVQLAKFAYDPYLVPLHDDPRFLQYQQRIRENAIRLEQD